MRNMMPGMQGRNPMMPMQRRGGLRGYAYGTYGEDVGDGYTGITSLPSRTGDYGGVSAKELLYATPPAAPTQQAPQQPQTPPTSQIGAFPTAPTSTFAPGPTPPKPPPVIGVEGGTKPIYQPPPPPPPPTGPVPPRTGPISMPGRMIDRDAPQAGGPITMTPPSPAPGTGGQIPVGPVGSSGFAPGPGPRGQSGPTGPLPPIGVEGGTKPIYQPPPPTGPISMPGPIIDRDAPQAGGPVSMPGGPLGPGQIPIGPTPVPPIGINPNAPPPPSGPLPPIGVSGGNNPSQPFTPNSLPPGARGGLTSEEDRVKADRLAAQLPPGLQSPNAFMNVNYFGLDPVLRGMYEEFMQLRYGIPAESIRAAAQRNRIGEAAMTGSGMGR